MNSRSGPPQQVAVSRRALTVDGLMRFVAWSSEVIERAAALMPELGLRDRELLAVLAANRNWMSRLWFGGAEVDRAALGLCAAEAWRLRMRRQASGHDPIIEGPNLMPRFLPGTAEGSVTLWRTDTNRNIPDSEARLTFSRSFLERHAPRAGLIALSEPSGRAARA